MAQKPPKSVMFGLHSIEDDSESDTGEHVHSPTQDRTRAMSPPQPGRGLSSGIASRSYEGPFKDPSYRPKVLKTMPHPVDSSSQYNLRKLSGRTVSTSSEGSAEPHHVVGSPTSGGYKVKGLTRGTSLDTQEVEAHILVLYSGGTIGMKTKEDGGE